MDRGLVQVTVLHLGIILRSWRGIDTWRTLGFSWLSVVTSTILHARGNRFCHHVLCEIQYYRFELAELHIGVGFKEKAKILCAMTESKRDDRG